MWTVPHDRNPYFTGRERVLTDLYQALNTVRTTALVQAEVLSGLGGVGKTQTALEYAYRYREGYRAVFWLDAETDLELRASYRKMARELGFPDLSKDEAEGTIRLVRHWLETNPGWLLILDNATDAESLRPFLPRGTAGQVLITSRASVFDTLGVTSPVQIDPMEPDEALDLLLSRTGRQQVVGEERAAATRLVEELGFLPLAIEQAGAYILPMKANFGEYLDSFRRRPITLLDKALPKFGPYEKTVSRTWDINFQQVREEAPAAAELLLFSAFLSPAPIPFDLVKRGGPELGPLLAKALEDVVAEPLLLKEYLLEPLHRYSLIGLDANADSFTIHRLVQQVVRFSLPEEEAQSWTTRTVNAFSRAFWDVDEDQWMSWGALIPHGADLTSRLSTQVGSMSAEMARILIRLGDHQIHTGQYALAETNLARALQIHEEELGGRHPDHWRSLNDYGLVLNLLGKTSESHPFRVRALFLCEESFGVDHPNTATCLDSMAGHHGRQGRYAEAEALAERALQIREKVLGRDHPDTARSMGNLAHHHSEQGRYAEAQALAERAMQIHEKALGSEHPSIATCLGNLARYHSEQGRHVEAQSLAERALQIHEKALGSEHPSTATSLCNLAGFHSLQGRYAEAEALAERAHQIIEKVLGPEHPDTARSMGNLAHFHAARGQYVDAQALAERALQIQEKVLGLEHPSTADGLDQLADVHFLERRYEVAQCLIQRAGQIWEKSLGLHHPKTVRGLRKFATVSSHLGQWSKANQALSQVHTALDALKGKDHPDFADLLREHAKVMRALGRQDSARRMEASASEIERKHGLPSGNTSSTGVSNARTRGPNFKRR